ncbi:MAG: aminoacyl-tRNA hydrolase [Clostridia bacterium]|nr:aminoacyl-tRNA hydrolase [Clostridia bacterium]
MADIFALFKQIAEKNNDNDAKEPISFIIVGLGNPGDKYFHTRHNAGFLAMDFISQKLGTKVDRLKFKALTGEAYIGGKRALLLKPQTYMNNSGEAVAEAASFYKIKPENIIVLFDDISLDVGRMRVRRDGSAGGHNGIKSIIAHLGSEKFPRIKIGVGKKPHPDYDLADWVLSEFSKEDKEKLFSIFGFAYEGLLKMLGGDFDSAMQICNGADVNRQSKES